MRKDACCNCLSPATLFSTRWAIPTSTSLLICIFVLIPFTGLYTFIGGLWGVLVTDLFQFALKMTMIIVLAWVAVAKIGGMQALQMQLQVVENNVRANGSASCRIQWHSCRTSIWAGRPTRCGLCRC